MKTWKFKIVFSGYSFPRDWWSYGVMVYQMLGEFSVIIIQNLVKRSPRNNFIPILQWVRHGKIRPRPISIILRILAKFYMYFPGTKFFALPTLLYKCTLVIWTIQKIIFSWKFSVFHICPRRFTLLTPLRYNFPEKYKANILLDAGLPVIISEKSELNLDW